MTQTPSQRTLMPWAFFLCLATATFALYWSGLRGPSLYDDAQHLSLVRQWLDGQIPLSDVLFLNGNVLTNRSVAMASFALSGWLGDYSIPVFKFANVLTHVLCAGIAFVMLSALLRRDQQLATHRNFYAGVVVTLWTLHPLHVSTVLYIVQHMAQVAALFSLLGVWVYAVIRGRMVEGRLREHVGVAMLFVLIAGLTFLGIQGKQSAIMLPALCLLVELAWFQQPRQWSHGMRLFFVCSVLLPCLVAVAAIAYYWSAIGDATLGWGMTIGERLRTQPRVLWDYIRLLIIPYSPSMGLFGDDFSVSRSLWSPPTTTLALLGLMGMSVVAWRLRARSPAVFVGWFWFLLAHAVEAGPAPIELYYEHRNYLPAVGLILMAIGLLQMLGKRLTEHGLRSQRIGWVLLAGFIIVLTGQTFSRVQIWRYGLSIGMSAYESHPGSIRAHLAYANALIDAGKVQEAYGVYLHLARQPEPHARAIGLLQQVDMECMVNADGDPAKLAEAVQLSKGPVNMAMPYIFAHLTGSRFQRGCGRITASMLGDAISAIADQATQQPDTAQAKWALRYNATFAYYQANELDKALQQAKLGWQPGSDPTIGLLVVTLMLHADEPAEAEKVFQTVLHRAGFTDASQIWNDHPRDKGLRKMRAMIDNYLAGKGKPALEGQMAPAISSKATPAPPQQAATQ